MNRSSTYLLSLVLVGISLIALQSCENWDLPGRKTKRDCTKPAGTLTVQAQQRKIDGVITGSSGTIDRVAWDFGNSSTTVTTGLTVSYTYPTPGTYTVKATLKNACDDNETTLQQVISVSEASAPVVSLQPASDITLTTATLRMAVTGAGNATISSYGVCYSPTNPQPEVGKGDPVVSLSGTIGLSTPVSFSLTGLVENTQYYVRAFAVTQ